MYTLQISEKIHLFSLGGKKGKLRRQFLYMVLHIKMVWNYFKHFLQPLLTGDVLYRTGLKQEMKEIEWEAIKNKSKRKQIKIG